jgi:hypothetical protein
MFQKNEAYDLALDAFARWQSARQLQVQQQRGSSKGCMLAERTPVAGTVAKRQWYRLHAVVKELVFLRRTRRTAWQ